MRPARVGACLAKAASFRPLCAFGGVDARVYSVKAAACEKSGASRFSAATAAPSLKSASYYWGDSPRPREREREERIRHGSRARTLAFSSF